MIMMPQQPVPVVKKQYGICCDTKMEVINESRLRCTKCGSVMKNLGEYGNKPESQKAQYNIYGGVMPGANILKTDEEKIGTIAQEYLHKIKNNKGLCDIAILRTASELMFQFSKGNTKKSQNRNQLFGGCLHYSSIRHKNILMDRDIVLLLKLTVAGISKGIGIITKYAIKHKIPFEFDPPIYRLAIKYYLRTIYYKGANLDTKKNRKFCRRLVEQINRLGIGYDKGILIKCSSAIYYMLSYIGIEKIYKKKELSKAMGLAQHVYTPIYKLLSTPEYNKLLSEDFQIDFNQ